MVSAGRAVPPLLWCCRLAPAEALSATAEARRGAQGRARTHLVQQQDDALVGVQAAHVALHIGAAAASRVARIQHLCVDMCYV
jgi:hypothetical protein